ncbi:MAG: hypothetical protein KF803_11120 [Cyclobacteriaceae bacterium]|nr:hypothetical protein [Cyclobacteriaceae bacterium]
MKRLIQFPAWILTGLTLLVSCERQEGLPKLQVCSSKYVYYNTGDSKVYLRQSLTEIWIVFAQEEITKEEAELILSKYTFLGMTGLASSYKQVGVRINENVTDCTIVNNYLSVLNEDEAIFSATPVFYYSATDPNSYFILLSEVLTKNNESLISESDFIDYAESMNLELVEAKYATQYFRVKEVKTGFEALEIANQIYESGKVEYAQPNGIVKVEPH